METPDSHLKKLAELLLAWERSHKEGHSISPEELCSAHPDLLEELRERIEALNLASALRIGTSKQSLFTGSSGTVDNTAVTTSFIHQPTPKKLGRYAIRRQLGRGGFGVVYLAHDTQLGRPVALKVPRRDRFRSAEQVASFIQEAQMAAKLDHPGLVAVYDVQEEAGVPYIVQQYIDGNSLASWASQKQPSYEQIAIVLLGITEALGYLHQNGLTHCDLKLANVLMDLRDLPHVADFGLAVHDSVRGSRKGARFGTPQMMAPEQVRGEGHRLDGRTDIWAMGVMLYELLVKQRPFTADRIEDLFEEIETLDPRPPRQIDPRVPRELERVCLHCLQKRRPERYNSCDDLREDLKAWLAKVSKTESIKTSAVTSAIQIPTTVEPESSKAAPSKILPKGLRSFDSEDADFFLDLLPGPRDRDGLPGSIRFWKNRIEEKDSEKTFEVGLIYGPSGCGKTSFAKAGLLPKLSNSILPIYVEATAGDTEGRILKQIRKVIPNLPDDATLPETCAILRKAGFGSQSKLLLVIDQFEQWLHAHTELKQSELVDALRQCNGATIQAILFVRDDFFASVHRLFQELECPLVDGRNYALIDRFDKQHARKVLIDLGRAYEKFGKVLTVAQEQFVAKAVDQLAEEEKVISIRLALFADMVKSREWTPATLQKIGGARGVGVTFLHETFSAKTANPTYRTHERAVRKVLNALLPETDSDLKGAMQSEASLRAVCGYESNAAAFREVLRILDQDLRVISPVDLDGGDRSKQFDNMESLESSARHYQLTHDFLVPSIREWLDDIDRQSAAGRARVRLRALARGYASTHDKRFLPTTLEFLLISRYVRPRDCDPAMLTVYKKTMARIATQVSAIALVVVALLAYAQSKRYEYQRRLADEWVNTWTSAQSLALPVALATLRSDKQQVVQSIHRRLSRDDNSANDALRLKLGMALLKTVSPTVVSELSSAIEGSSYEELPIFRMAFSNNRSDALNILLESFHSTDNDETAVKVAIVLLHLGNRTALDACLNAEETPVRRAITEHAVGEDCESVDHWLDLLRNSGPQDHDRLACIVSGLGRRNWNSTEVRVKKAWLNQLKRFYRESPSGPMHSASEYALRKIDALSIVKAESGESLNRAGFNWFRAENGLTFVRVPAAGRKVGRAILTLSENRKMVNLDVGTGHNFWMSTTEVHGGLFQKFAERPEFKERWKRTWQQQEADIPAVNMRIAEAMDFCNWLSRKESLIPCYIEVDEELPLSPLVKESLGSSVVKEGHKVLRNWKVNTEGTGYRLPNHFELIFSVFGERPEFFSSSAISMTRDYVANHYWFIENTAATGNRLQICGQLMPNSFGLFDSLGNACESGIDTRSRQLTARQLTLTVDTKSSLQDVLLPNALPIYLWNITPDQGFRLVVESMSN